MRHVNVDWIQLAIVILQFVYKVWSWWLF
jgi:hypothetical protein